jgi:hypothetical protein
VVPVLRHRQAGTDPLLRSHAQGPGFTGAFGVMFDDIFAAFYTLLVFACGVRSDTQKHRNTPGISGTAVMSVSRLLDQLAIQAGAALSESSLMLATAESCTGGLVAAAITDVSGSSGWFERGFVTYSNEAKTTMVGCRPN